MPNRLKMQIEPKGKVLEIYLYSEIAPDGEDWWTGEKIPSETSANTIRQAIADHPDCTEIKLVINSFGGDVREGYGICGELRRFSGPVNCYVDGFANSIASVIAMVADKIYMYKNSIMTIHNMMSMCFGNAADHRAAADALDTYMKGNRQLYLDHAGDKLTEEKLIEMLDAETVLTAQDCLEYGLCDEIIDQTSTRAEEAQEAVQRYAKTMAQAARYAQSVQAAFHAAMQSRIPEPEAPQTLDENTVLSCLKAEFNMN